MIKNKSSNSSSLSFMNEMVDTYHGNILKDEVIVFELYFKDLDETYQLHMNSNECILKTKDFSDYNTRFETNFKEFSDIVTGKVDNDNLLITKKDNNVLGEFRTIPKLLDLFGLYAETNPVTVFMMGMVTSYNIGLLKDEEIILELYFKDINKTYQIHMSSNDCILKTNNFSKYTTRIETTFKTWKAMSEGELSHMDGLISRKYKVLGNFKTMLKLLDLYDILNEK